MADILNDLLHTEYTESKFRKQRQAFDKMLAANQSKYVDTDAQLKELDIQKRELERAKIQFRDERRSWNKQNYENARFDEVMSILDERLDSERLIASGKGAKSISVVCCGFWRDFVIPIQQ